MKQADAASSNDEANRLNQEAVALRVANSKIDGRIQQLDFQTHSLMQDIKKIGPNLKDVRLKLNRNWIPVWLKKPTDFRPTTKMPNFRLTDHQIQTISAYLWQSGFTDALPKQKPGNAEHGKQLFETRGCLACHSIGEGDQMQGGTFAANLSRVGEKANYDYLVRWIHNARERTRPYCPYEKKDIGPEDYAKKGLPYQFDLQHSRCPNDGHELQVQNMTVMPSLRLSEEDAQDIASYLMTEKKEEPSAYAQASYMDDPALKEEGKKWIRHYGCAGCHEISGFEDEGRIGTELTYEGSKPIERLDFALFTNVAERGGKNAEPITDPEDLARLPEGPAKGPWYDHKGFFEHKLAEPNVYDKGKVKSETEALRMPNLHLSKLEIQDLTTFLLGSEESSLPDSYQYKPGDARQRYSGRLVDRQEVQLRGLPPVHARSEHGPDGHETLSGHTGAAASEAPDRRCARRSRVAAEIPFQSGAEHHRHQSQRRAAVPASAHADILVLRQRTAQAGALLPGAVAAAHAVHSGAGAGAEHERNGDGAQPVLEHGRSLPEVPRHRRSAARQDRHRAQLPAGERTPEAGLGRALDTGSASHQPRHFHAFGSVQAGK